MRRFFLRLLCFIVPVAVALAVELFMLPVNRFTFRCWEALWIESNRDCFRGGYYYPNMDIAMVEQGDLAPYTEYAVKKHARWVTDRYGYRTKDSGDGMYPIIIIGDSMTVGTSLSQENTLPEVLGRKIRMPAYPFAPRRTINDYIAEQRFLRHRPLIVIVEAAERNIADLPKIGPVLQSEFKQSPVDCRWGEKYLVLRDRFHKQVMYNYLKKRVFGLGIKPPGKSYAADPREFFYEGEAAIKDASAAEIDDIANRIVSYNKYFARWGIHFVFLPVPNKETIYYRSLPSKTRHVFLEKLIARLKAENIDVVDILPAFRNAYESQHVRLYHSDDSHWNENAVLLAAELLCKHLQPVKKQDGTGNGRVRQSEAGKTE